MGELKIYRTRIVFRAVQTGSLDICRDAVKGNADRFALIHQSGLSEDDAGIS
jgi:hypothetical protein